MSQNTWCALAGIACLSFTMASTALADDDYKNAPALEQIRNLAPVSPEMQGQQDDVLATVNGKPIGRGLVRQYGQAYQTVFAIDWAPDAKLGLSAVIDAELLAQE